MKGWGDAEDIGGKEFVPCLHVSGTVTTSQEGGRQHEADGRAQEASLTDFSPSCSQFGVTKP